jgi:succinate dehydrogenase / fumarate reductase, membrane anchor subunit
MNRIVVGAHYGLKDWLAQRITAVVMALFTVVVLAGVCAGAGSSLDAWRAFIGQPVIRFLAFIFILSLFYHVWVGVRDIWMDYVKNAGVRLTLHVLTLLALVGQAGWAVQILWRL